ncbi:MAG: rRNA pseudouridine synthase [Tenericutes bacterium]|nr:MAG: rRNA pseudouridine synthase [Mycoplasmatota bacterium]
MKQERLQKLLSQAGIASRRKSEELIKAGEVKVNGKIATLGDKATMKDEIVVKGQQIIKEEPVYYLLNKPEKTISSLRDPEGRALVVDLIDDSRHIYPVGRLDYNTTGTLILTNDGDLANKLAHPSNEIIRVYRARLDAPLTDKELRFLNSEHVKLDNKKVKQEVTQVDKKTYVVVLKVGSYHHVKKLFELVKRRVQGLTRIEFAGLTHVGKLSRGQYRELSPKEVKRLKGLV